MDTTPIPLLFLFAGLVWAMFGAVEFAHRRNRRRELLAEDTDA